MMAVDPGRNHACKQGEGDGASNTRIEGQRGFGCAEPEEISNRGGDRSRPEPQCGSAGATGAGAAIDGPVAPTADNAVMLTIFFKHDQSRLLSELNAQLDRQGFYKAFPPAGVEVVSWYVMMGIGQVVALRLPASRLREVNRILENTAWGSYRTEFYPTYDYKPTELASHEKAQSK